MPFHPHIAVYNHCTCAEIFWVLYILWYLEYGCLWGTNCWLLTLKVNNYQNTELRKWIAFHVMIVWLLVCLVVPINCVVLYVINCCKIDVRT